MKPTKVNPFKGRAKKLKAPEYIEYYLWIDDEGYLYIQMVDQEAKGTMSHGLVPVSKYINKRTQKGPINPIEVYDLEKREWDEVTDNNNGAFVKAVLQDLFPDDDK